MQCNLQKYYQKAYNDFNGALKHCGNLRGIREPLVNVEMFLPFISKGETNSNSTLGLILSFGVFFHH